MLIFIYNKIGGYIMVKYAYTLLGSLLIASSAFADSTESYKYGDTLDISKVISMSQLPDNNCEVVPAKMVYLDSKGIQHTMEYQVLSNGCPDN
jgi:hypothetical protein